MQRDFHAKYSLLVRIAPNEIGRSDPKAAKIIYGIKSGYSKTGFLLSLGQQNIFQASKPFHLRRRKLHADRRGTVNAVYSLSNVLKSKTALQSMPGAPYPANEGPICGRRFAGSDATAIVS
jgi:hypothetical protein